MQENRSSPNTSQGCLREVGAALLAVCLLLIVSAGYQNFDDRTFCGGGLGAGFPVSYLCDYGSGGSPIDNWGRIDLSDFPYFTLPGLLVDMLFYAVILWMGWLARRAIRPGSSYPTGSSWWIVLIGVAFAVGFLTAAAIYKSDRINFHNYLLNIPTSVPATPTPFGTPPPPAISPAPT